VRKTLRLTKPRQRNVNTHDGVDDYLAMDCRIDTYHTQNLEFLDREYGFDEFGDIDDEHEQLGAAWLTDHFVPEVVEPIRLHVAAKRYLCAVDGDYFSMLSPPSVQSLHLQGGPMTPAQAAHFEKHPHFQEAIQLRRIDDQAKIPNLSTPPLTHYRDHLSQSLIARGSN
jgi:gamma-butyrobetaine dioxygenase